MLVYRFENERGFGPYRGEGCVSTEQFALHADLCDAHQDGYHRPIWEDVSGFKSGDMFCGCPSIEHLKDWFDGFVERLFKVGYSIACYDVPEYDVHAGRDMRQVAFDWENAELVERIKTCPNL